MASSTVFAPAPLAADLVQGWLRQAKDHAVIAMDPHGVIVDWLAAAEVLLGHTRDEAVGQHVALIFTHEDREKGYANYELKVAAEDRFSEDSRWHVRKDGTRIWVSGTVTAVRDADGRILGFLKVLRDMTDERSHTERFVNELSEMDLARDNTRTFLRTLGHELRNPLAVLSNVQMILDRVVQDERGRKAVQQLAAQVGMIKKIADDLMDVSRVELGKVELELEPADLRDVLQESTQNLLPAAAKKSISIEVLLPPAPLVVHVDRSRIQQVVLNLVSNAIKYTPVRGHVWIKASEEGDEVVCRVQDDGIGIFPPMLPKMFELFTQGSEGQAMREGGIGVGLALVRQLVELHGGTVQARSAGLGKGSEFVFRLPNRS